MKRGIVAGCLIAIGFSGSCVVLIRPADRLAEPLTRRPMTYDVDRPFPVAIVKGEQAVIRKLSAPFSAPTLEADESFLVPSNASARIERALNEQQASSVGEWRLHVSDTAPGAQRIELYWDGDGYDGGAYDATATTIRPVYRKVTGPAFAAVVLAITLALNLVLWAAVTGAVLMVRRFRRRR